ncbi:MAG: transglutaminase domain-containing protein [Clostridiales bacterium]|nr:transglutaminase domain-containing protein [Clostridiales bacterium]
MTDPQEPLTEKNPAILSMDRFMDACCCFFLSAGLLYALYKPLAQEPASSWAFACLPLLFLLPAFLLGRRLPVVFVACSAIFLLLGYTNESPWFITSVDFVRWWAGGFVPANADFFHYYYVAVRLLLAGAVTLGLWLLIRCRLHFWLLLLGCPIAVAAVAYFGLRGFNISIYLLAAGLAPLAAAGTVSRNRLARGRAAAYAMPITLIVLGIAYVALPADTAALRWVPLGDKVEEWRETARVYYWEWRIRNESISAFDLTEEYHASLGGPIEPGRLRMMTVMASEPMLLKGAVYDQYTGHSWKKNVTHFVDVLYAGEVYSFVENGVSAKAVAFTPETPESELDRILGLTPSPGSEHPLAPFARRISAEITLLHPQEPRLFYGGRIYSFSSGYDIEPFLEQNAELKSWQPLNVGWRYEFSGLTLDRAMPGFAAAVADSYQRQDIQEQRENHLDIMQLGIYRQLPAGEDYLTIRHFVQELVNEGLAEGESRGPYDQALLLEHWLRNNCAYTLAPKEPPDDKDFVLHFLETREGYCAYYATAMVIMARMLDISARYVTGYALLPLGDSGRYEATQATAHAWAELFFDGVGWLPFDPTGQADYTESGWLSGSNLEDNEPFHMQIGGGAVVDPVVDGRLLWLAVLIFIAAALLSSALIFIRRLSAYRLPKLRKRFAPGIVLEIYYRDLLGQLDMLGWQRAPAETIIVFAQRIGGYLPWQSRQLRDLSAAICALRYGGLTPDEDSLLNAAALHDDFEDMLQRKLNRSRYYSYRVLHGPKARSAMRP